MSLPEKNRYGTNCWGYALHRLGLVQEAGYIESPTPQDLEQVQLVVTEDKQRAVLVGLLESGYAWLFHALVVEDPQAEVVSHFSPFHPDKVPVEPIKNVLNKFENDNTFRAVTPVYFAFQTNQEKKYA